MLRVGIKNYLYRRYDEQLAAYEISQYVRNYQINQLSTKAATLGFLLGELERVAVPAPASVEDLIIRNAKAVNNSPNRIFG